MLSIDPNQIPKKTAQADAESLKSAMAANEQKLSEATAKLSNATRALNDERDSAARDKKAAADLRGELDNLQSDADAALSQASKLKKQLNEARETAASASAAQEAMQSELDGLKYFRLTLFLTLNFIKKYINIRSFFIQKGKEKVKTSFANRE